MPDLKRLERFVEMLSMIDRGEAVTAKSLAAHFGVTERTIYRDILILQTDFPIAFDYERNSYCFSVRGPFSTGVQERGCGGAKGDGGGV